MKLKEIKNINKLKEFDKITTDNTGKFYYIVEKVNKASNSILVRSCIENGATYMFTNKEIIDNFKLIKEDFIKIDGIKTENNRNSDYIKYEDRVKEVEERVNHPSYYNNHPSGVECIDIIRYYCFSIGSAIKYLWRAGLKTEEGLTNKDKEIEDLNKAIWFIKDRIKELKKINNA